MTRLILPGVTKPGSSIPERATDATRHKVDVGDLTGRSIGAAPARLERSAGPSMVFLETFGCQMNEYDTEIVRSLLTADGFLFTESPERADVVLMNTCAIRENAHKRVYGHLAELRAAKEQRGLVIGVLGCMAQNLKDELTEAEPIVDLLVGPDSYRRLPDLIHRVIEGRQAGVPGSAGAKRFAVDLSEYETYEGILPERTEGVNAWIAIMRGCDNFCSFCVVPYTRGRERSRDPEGVLQEAEHLLHHGHKQITLLGQNVNSYRFGEWDFARLLTAVADLPGVERVRFTSPHPKDFPPGLIEAMAAHPKICKHVHLPLQSGNDRILDLMGRTYTRGEYMNLVEDLRRRIPGVALTTDIICGFCTETESDFLDTYRTVQEVGYHSAFIFKYSERRNTIAERKHRDDVPDALKADRVTRLVEIQRAISHQKHHELVGSTLPVLVEGNSKKSAERWMGRTDTNITVVWDKNNGDPSEGRACSPGDVVPITISSANAATLFGLRGA